MSSEIHENGDVDVDTMLSMLLEEDSPRSIGEAEVWGGAVLLQAWSAAISEFKAYAAAAPGLPAVLDREQQLIASPLWYAPPPLTKASPVSKKRSYQEAMDNAVGEHIEDEEEVYEDASTDKQVNENASDEAVEQGEKEQGEEEGEPYFNPDDYEPVSPNISHRPRAEAIEDTEAITAPFPDPPPIDEALPQDPALLASTTSQEALQKALNAWYTAGYAAALYHVKSGMV